MNDFKSIFLPVFLLITSFSFAQNMPLNHFEAYLGEKYVFLTWETGDSIIHYPFEIQRSTDGRFFETVGIMEMGQDNYYEYVDSSAKGYYSVLYYRLCQKQSDLFALYSPIISLQKINVSSPVPIVFPTPVKETLFLDYSPSDGKWMFIRIADQAGKIIYESPKMLNVHLPKWDVSRFASGLYHLIVISQNEVHSTYWIKE